MAERAQPESPFHIPLFRAMWLATLCSNFGSLIQSVGASWQMTMLHASPQMIALVQGSVTLPIMLLSLVSGAIADNFDRRQVLLSAQIFMLVVSVGLTVLAWLGLVGPWTILLSTFLLGCGTALNNPAWQASVGDMVPRHLLPGAVAYNSVSFNLARSTGPAVGGAIVAVAGAAAAYAVNALSYLGIIAALFRWRPEYPERRLPREGLLVAMEAGVRYVALSPQLRVVLLRASLFGLAGTTLTALLPLVARDLIGGGPGTFGVLLGAFGVGAVGGAFAGNALRSRLSTEWIIRLSALAIAAGTAMTAASTTLIVTLPALALAGAGWLLSMSTFNVSVQMASPRWVVARAISCYQVFAFGGMALGSWLFGALATAHGVPEALFFAAGAQLLAGLLGLFLPLPRISNLNHDPVDTWREPTVTVSVDPRSGPISITLEHHIAEEDIPPLMALMQERRRIRGRNGARGWSLSRDLSDPTLWIERFRFATWLDYLRHNERRTRNDQINSEALDRLRISGTQVVVHRMLERDTGSPPLGEIPDPEHWASIH